MTARTISDDATLVVAGDLLTSEFGTELVILNLRDGVYYGLEDVGARIWALLQAPVDFITLRDALVSEYDVDPPRCERDLRALLAELVACRLVEVRDGRA